MERLNLTTKSVVRSVLHRIGLTNEAKFRKAIAEDRLSNPDDYLLADRILEHFHSQGGLSQYIQPYKLVSLQRLLTLHRPKQILELGTGSSSIIFAAYACEHGANVTHVDESERWLANTQRNISNLIDEDYKNSTFRQVEKRVSLDTSPNEFCYAYEISEEFDLIFVDGPSLIAADKEYKSGVCTDVLKLTDETLPAMIVVDIRAPTVTAIASKYAKSYEANFSDILNKMPCSGFRYYSEFSKINS